ncbi:hypothetical protein NQ314_003672 [Rhamnusium bicolor]|uniref:Uncharacterized protein n=1 Tax=Rhamnusium bicolor TaxID=1586634 RepID=A0AAV8ZN55_9CUCU|nr:hypothetical protein NQ314_003672 [Rhamnusium bicolor]
MARGILRLQLSRRQICDIRYSLTKRQQYSARPKKYTTVLENAGTRNFCTSNQLRKDAQAPSDIKGIPYKNLTVGVPKEIWKNERR